MQGSSTALSLLLVFLLPLLHEAVPAPVAEEIAATDRGATAAEQTPEPSPFLVIESSESAFPTTAPSAFTTTSTDTGTDAAERLASISSALSQVADSGTSTASDTSTATTDATPHAVSAPSGAASAFPTLARLDFAIAPPLVRTCTATLLSASWLLTAAHCAHDTDTNNQLHMNLSHAFLQPASTTVSAPQSGNETMHAINSVLVHRLYDPSATTPAHDVALVRLREPVRAAESAAAHAFARLVGEPPAPDARVRVARHVFDEEVGGFVRSVHELVAPGFAACLKAECPGCRGRAEAGVRPEEELHACGVAVGHPVKGRTEGCDGESGSPVIRVDGAVYAVSSFSTRLCTEAGAPSWYTRLAPMRDAIYSVLLHGSHKDFRSIADA